MLTQNEQDALIDAAIKEALIAAEYANIKKTQDSLIDAAIKEALTAANT